MDIGQEDTQVSNNDNDIYDVDGLSNIIDESKLGLAFVKSHNWSIKREHILNFICMLSVLHLAYRCSVVQVSKKHMEKSSLHVHAADSNVDPEVVKERDQPNGEY